MTRSWPLLDINVLFPVSTWLHVPAGRGASGSDGAACYQLQRSPEGTGHLVNTGMGDRWHWQAARCKQLDSQGLCMLPGQQEQNVDISKVSKCLMHWALNNSCETCMCVCFFSFPKIHSQCKQNCERNSYSSQ